MMRRTRVKTILYIGGWVCRGHNAMWREIYLSRMSALVKIQKSVGFYCLALGPNGLALTALPGLNFT
jgi:hypothetical protein